MIWLNSKYLCNVAFCQRCGITNANRLARALKEIIQSAFVVGSFKLNLKSQSICKQITYI